tara:strand:+ start:1414 stop:1770 length:357 start_codon:yes stop_codon:yes gene_type:complete
MFKYVRIWQNDKKLDEWGKKIRKKLPNKRLLEHFEADFSQIKKSNEFTRASFVMYWEIQTDTKLATVAPPIVQGTLVSMTNRLVEMERMDEAQVVNAMMINFTRVLGIINSGVNDEEE